MDYEKKYKEALEKARQLCAYPTTKPLISDLQNLFPELKESEDERIRKELIEFVDTNTLSVDERHNRWLAWLEKQGEKPAWGEEDEKIMNTTLCIISDFRNVYKDSKEAQKDADKIEDWLKSLRNRVRPSQGWGEEDERIKNNLLSELTNLSVRKLIEKETEKKYASWLKSLRPQSHWKPSEEQIKKELDKAANEWECKASFSPIAMVMDGDRPIGTKQHITSHADSFKAGVDWLIKKLREE